MTAQTPDPVTTAPDVPLTFEAPPPVAPGRPNPIKRAWPWGKPITPAQAEAAAVEHNN